MKLQRTVHTPASPERVFAYLSDFSTTNEWDPGTVHTRRVSGDGGVGTVYHNRSRFLGRESELTYTVTAYSPPRQIVLHGHNDTLDAYDTIDVHPQGSGTLVTYTADFQFTGIAKLVVPLLAPAFKKLGDDAEQGMIQALAKLAP